MNLKKSEEISKKLLILYFFLQPFLDLNLLYNDNIVSIFKFSPSTIIRMLIIAVVLFLSFYNNKNKGIHKNLIIYFFVVFTYNICHIINASNFNYPELTTYNFSLFAEVFYLIRMVIPIILIFLVYKSKINSKNLRKIIVFVSLIFSITIIVSSIFKFGIGSYGGREIKYSIFDWFINKDISKTTGTTVGLFVGANRLGVFMGALLVINCYHYFNEKSNKIGFVILLQNLAMMIIGTKIGTYLWLIVMIFMTMLTFVLSLNKNNFFQFDFKKNLFWHLILFVSFITLLNSPIFILNTSKFIGNNNTKVEMEKSKEIINNEKKIKNEEWACIEQEHSDCKKEKILHVENLIVNNKINVPNLYFQKIYSYKIDPDFWIGHSKKPIKADANRNLQPLIFKRIKNINNNKFDTFLGLGYSTVRSGGLYLERDFLVHYFTLGIIGVLIFLVPYLAIIIYSGIHILKNLRKHISFELLTYIMAICLFIFTSLLSGHIVDEMITYSFLALFCGLTLRTIDNQNKDKKQEKTVSVIIPIYNVEKYLDECLDSLERQSIDKNKMEVILINDGSTDNSKKIIKKHLKTNKNWIFIDQKNHGLAITRNKGINLAKGDYIVFLDSDDYLEDDAILKMSSIINKYDLDLVVCQLTEFNSTRFKDYYSSKYISNHINYSIEDDYKLLNAISVCGKIYKSSLVKKCSFLKNVTHEDNYFSLKVFNDASKIGSINYPVYNRRIREDNTSIMQNLNLNNFVDLNYNFNKFIDEQKTLNINYSLFILRKLINYQYKNLNEEERKESTKITGKTLNKIKLKTNSTIVKKSVNCYYNFYLFLVKKYFWISRGLKNEEK